MGPVFWQISRFGVAMQAEGTVNRRHAAEFPNDNPELHDGTLWICLEVCSAPRPLRVPRPTAYDALIAPPSAELGAVVPPVPAASVSVGAPVIGLAPPVELASLVPPIEASVELVAARPGLAKALPESDPFQRFVQAMVDVAKAAGGSRAAAILPALLERGTTRPDALDPPALDALGRRGLWVGRQPSPRFVATLAAFRETLRGESADLAICGEYTLDRWAAELLAALLGWSSGRAEELRRPLRRSGVAAFGMLERAA